MTTRQNMTSARRQGFTLIEILAVAVILAIVGALVLPRLSGKSVVTAQLAAEQVSSLLGTFAFRSSLAGQPVSLLRDPDFGTIEVWILDIDPNRPDQPPAWRIDRFAKPLTLPEGIALSEVRIDGQRLVPEDWSVIAVPGMPRPRIELVLTSDKESEEITVVLDPRAGAPHRISAGGTTAIGRVPVDLDREGRGKELW